MKWTYGIKEKLKIAMALTVVILLVLITSMINKNHFTKLQESFTSVYEDRLLVENYIYKLSRELNEKRMAAYNRPVEDHEGNKSDQRIDVLISNFQNTTLTTEESTVLEDFVEQIKVLREIELEYKNSADDQADTLNTALEEQFDILSADLSRLSDIQLEEGKKLMETSTSIVTNSHLYSQLEIILVIGIGLVIQALIFASKSLRPKLPQNEHLN
ncbi:MAG: MCP four helix bundle domain-containing protein [Fulvivirga sp.]